MDWADEPATEIQLSQLRRFGYKPDHALARGDAAHLISDFEAHPECEARLSQGPVHDATKLQVYRLRVAVVEATQAVATADQQSLVNCQNELSLAMVRRREFWLDTCREPGRMHSASADVLELYMKHGCRFVEPTHEEVQEILDALDSAMPFWDRDYPQLFYQTLELNRPELLRHC